MTVLGKSHQRHVMHKISFIKQKSSERLSLPRVAFRSNPSVTLPCELLPLRVVLVIITPLVFLLANGKNGLTIQRFARQ